ncbi:MAG TPA: peptidase U32 family protein [Candidatus Udaeobacter sp.]|nr:peptidase U32 family protein [Candidatus Udaeobacter sp.]
MSEASIEIVAPAGTPAALRAAVDAGADAVYAGFRDETNARNFPGLNFSREEMAEAIGYIHARGRKLFLAVNTFAEAGRPEPWRRAVDDAARFGADSVILADIGLLDYAASRHPQLRRHLSVQAAASNPEAIRLYAAAFGVRRVVLPRVLTLEAIAKLVRSAEVEFEVFAFGGMCVMAEGRCALSSYVTGLSPNMHGVCSPPSHVRYEARGDTLVSLLGGLTIDRFAPGEPAGYPTLCKGRFCVRGEESHLFEDPVSLSALDLLSALGGAGVRALKIEGRQRGPVYVGRVVAAFRQAIDAVARGEAPPTVALGDLTEGARVTAGAYRKGWR